MEQRITKYKQRYNFLILGWRCMACIGHKFLVETAPVQFRVIHAGADNNSRVETEGSGSNPDQPQIRIIGCAANAGSKPIDTMFDNGVKDDPMS